MIFTPLYFYHNLHRAPGLALDAVIPYAQGVNHIKNKTAHFIHICENQVQNVAEVVYPILRHPRSSTISGILLSTKCMANLTGLGFIYKKLCYVLSRRAGQITSIENQILLKLKKLSSYCIQLNTSYIPWQKIPEIQALEILKAELLNYPEQSQEITTAVACCDEVHALITLHFSMTRDVLSPEEMQVLKENAGLDTMLLAAEENAGELLGSYTPQLLGSGLNELVSALPESYNPFVIVSDSLMITLRKVLAAIGGSSILTITSSNYFFTSSNAQKTLLQLFAISGVSAAGLYYQEHPIMQQAEEGVKEALQTLLEIPFAYLGMLLFKTDESFNDYFKKIIPATAASKATAYYLDYTESYAITSFALPLLVSSMVYNQACIKEAFQSLKKTSIRILNGEAQKQLLQPIASSITEHIITNSAAGLTNCTAGLLSQIALRKIITPTIPSSTAATLTSTALGTYPPLKDLFSPVILPVITQLMQQLVLQGLNLSLDKSLILLKEYLAILQQDEIQALLLKIQQKLDQLDPEVEGLKNQFLKEVFVHKTGKILPLDNNTPDFLKIFSGLDVQAILFASFKDAPPIIRMLWNSYSYHKKVDQSLTLELLLEGFIISSLIDLTDIFNTLPKQPSFSYLKTADLGINLIL
ncbi:MAG: hypothetical protein ACRDAI_07340 [Candidatus Rhabdochlamydia sp.]